MLTSTVHIAIIPPPYSNDHLLLHVHNWGWQLGAETCRSWYLIWSALCMICFVVFY